MDKEIFYCLNKKQEPFDGVTISLVESIPLNLLGDVIKRVLELSEKEKSFEEIFLCEDWQGAGGFLPEKYVIFSNYYKDMFSSEARMIKFMPIDEGTALSIYCSGNFYLRFWVERTEDLEEENLTGGFSITIAKDTGIKLEEIIIDEFKLKTLKENPIEYFKKLIKTLDSNIFNYYTQIYGENILCEEFLQLYN